MLTVSPHEKLRRSGARFGVFPILDELKRQDMKSNNIYMTTGSFECGFIHLTEPSKFDKYGVEMIFDQKDPAYIELERVIDEAGKGAGVEDGHNPIKPATGWDSVKEEKVPRTGFVSITAKTNKESLQERFKLVDAADQKLELGDLRRGNVARAKIGVHPYDTGTNKGVTIYLNAVQKISGDDFESFGPLPDQPPAQQGEDLAW